MKKSNGGYALSMVLAVGMILIIFVLAILASSSALYRRNIEAANRKQARLTARSVLDLVTDSLEHPEKNSEIYAVVMKTIGEYAPAYGEGDPEGPPSEEPPADDKTDFPDDKEDLPDDKPELPDDKTDLPDDKPEFPDDKTDDMKLPSNNETVTAYGKTENEDSDFIKPGIDNRRDSLSVEDRIFDENYLADHRDSLNLLPSADSEKILLPDMKFYLDDSMGTCIVKMAYYPAENMLVLTAIAEKGTAAEQISAYIQCSSVHYEGSSWHMVCYGPGEEELD